MTALDPAKFIITDGSPSQPRERQDVQSSSYGESDILNIYRYPSGTDIQALIDDGGGPTEIYLSNGTYTDNFDVTRAVNIYGNGPGTILTSGSGTTLTVSANLVLRNLSVTCPSGSGTTIKHNQNYNVDAKDCLFSGYESQPSSFTTQTGYYKDCEFWCLDIASDGIICHNKNVIFKDCIFDGLRGIEYRDSVFYDCRFGNKVDHFLPAHGGTGSKELNDSSTGFNGDSEFYGCEFFSTDNAITMGHELHIKLVNCYVWATNNPIFVRGKNDFKAYNCTLESTDSRCVLFNGEPAVGAVDTTVYGESCLIGCVLIPADGEEDIQCPPSLVKGFVTIRDTTFGGNGIYAIDGGLPALEEALGFCRLQAPNTVSHTPRRIEAGELVPIPSMSTRTYERLIGVNGSDVATAVTIKLGKMSLYLEEIPDGTIITLLAIDATGTITIQGGANSVDDGAGGTDTVYTFLTTGSTLLLSPNDSATFIYTTHNLGQWQQI